ncbi:MAG TPA: HAD family hydrolase [Panacibacter sp.]|nr:HAD family hydrolase [Panacibacter sp.]HNP43945.1 HAD family hydrolase [Panacibacter sp.]
MNKIKAVIFDLDGTIADTLPLCIAAFRQSIEPLIGRSVSDEEIVATFGPSEEGTIMALAPAHYERGIASYLQHYENLHGLCPLPFDGMAALLRMLSEKNIRIAMVTGKGIHSTAISLRQFGIDDYFEQVETGWVHGPRKPEGIEAVLQAFNGITKEEVIYVGDSPGDITASRQAGIAAIAVAWAKSAEPEKLAALNPDELFYSVEEFRDWLTKRIITA